MQITTKKLPKNEIEFSIEVSAEEIVPYLAPAAKRLSEKHPIDGFRPGHAPYDIIKQRMGEMAIYDEALDDIVRGTFFEALKSEQRFETLGLPKIDIEKFAPDNPLLYRATVALMPHVTRLDYSKIRVEKKSIEVSDKEIEDTLKMLQGMQSKEVIANHAAGDKDKIIVDMEMFLDTVPVEGGQTKSHSIYLSEKYYIPEVREKLVGIKKDEERRFQVVFPKEHYQKHLAGKNVEFKVTCKDVFEVIPPALDDSFAQTLGVPTLDELKKTLKKNIEEEKKTKEDERIEQEIIRQLITASSFDSIPDILINHEVNKMLSELEHSVKHQGMKFDDYLKQIKKSIGDLKLDFAPKALERVQAALAIKAVAKEKNFIASEEEIEAEIQKAIELYKDDKTIQEKLQDNNSREYLASVIINKKVLDFLKEK